jgi:hypothetical protein
LLLLRKMAASDVRLAKAMLQLGALQQLHAVPTSSSSSGLAAAAIGAEPAPAAAVIVTPGFWPDELLPSVRSLGELLMGGSAGTSRAADASSDVDSAAGGDGGDGGDGTAGVHQSAREQRPLYLNQPGSSSVGRTSNTAVGQRFAQGQQQQQQADTTPSKGLPMATALPSDAVSAMTATMSGRLVSSWAAPDSSSHVSPVAAAAAAAAAADSRNSSTACSDELDERLLRARARADWRRQQQADTVTASPDQSTSKHLDAPAAAGPPPSAFDTLLAGGCGQPASAWHVVLPVVPLSAADDQALFEVVGGWFCFVLGNEKECKKQKGMLGFVYVYNIESKQDNSF